MSTDAKKVTAIESANYVANIINNSLSNRMFILGVGSGSTIAEFIPALTERLDPSVNVIGIPTSYQAQELIITSRIIKLGQLCMYPEIDLIVDGADEIHLSDTYLTEERNRCFMIKGGGGCMLREKIVAEAAKQRIYIAHDKKMSSIKFPIPVEVIPMSVISIMRQIGLRFPSISIRQCTSGKAGPIVTDNGNFILDFVPNEPFDPLETDQWLNSISGIVEHGLFVLKVHRLIIGSSDGKVRHIQL